MLRYSLVGALILFTGCGGGTHNATAELTDVTELKSLTYETLYYGPSLFGRRIREVVVDAGRWHAIWDSTGDAYKRTEFREIDFSRQVVILAAGGPPMLWGDSLAITSVERIGQKVRVQITIFSQCSIVTASIVPAHIILVAKFETAAAFRETELRPPGCPRL